MKKAAFFGIVILALTFAACNSGTGSSTANTDSSSPFAAEVDSLLNIMTLEEKIGQMNQYNGFWNVTGPVPAGDEAANKKYDHLKKGWVGSMLNVRGVENVRAVQKIAVEETRLGIPLIIGFDAIHGYKTLSPIPLAESASWDMEAIRRSAEVSAAETAASGINWTFAPMVDIGRDPRWGRVMEGAGEDPYLGSKIAMARVKGFQGDDLSDPFTIAACTKHFAGYGFAEGGKDYNTADFGSSTLYNMVLPPFKATVDADVKTFMNSFNVLNGIPATGDEFLQREILKGQWNFQGFVVSDWGSIGEMVAHGYAKDGKHAAELAANAGSDMDMESYLYVEHLAKLVRAGKVDEAYINDAARRILTVKYELGLFEDPYKYCDEAREKATIGKEAHQEAVLDMAKKSIVLLKNENKLLPLKKSGQRIAVIGQFANDKNSPLGSWRIAADDNTAVSLMEGMAAYPDNRLTYALGAQVSVGPTSFVMETQINEDDTSGFAEAIRVARAADVVIMNLGEVGWQSGEGRSRVNIDLPGVQQELLEAVYKVNKNIVLVLQSGRPLALPWADENIPAIVQAWQLGTQSGNAIAQVLYGDYNPSGKMPMTTPRDKGQIPLYYNHKSTGRPTIPAPNLVFWSHYMDESNAPLYPFGHGLSYTEFKYDGLEVNANGDGTYKVSFTLTNSGAVKGKEVAQLYIQDVAASVTRPVRELKGFELVELEPGASKEITFNLSDAELGFYNNEGEFIVEDGLFRVFVGGSSATQYSTEFAR